MISLSIAFVIFFQLSIACLAQSVHSLPRIHHTLVRLPNNTILVLGGFDTLQTLSDTRTHLDNQTTFDQSIAGHTSHWYPPTQATVSLFGLHGPGIQTEDETGLAGRPRNSDTSTLPVSRYGHTSTLLGNDLYVLGGFSIDANQLRPLGDLWVFRWRSRAWIQASVSPVINHTPIAGHTTVSYNNWLLSCFGMTRDNALSTHCTCIDTLTSTIHIFNATLPEPRTMTTMTVLPLDPARAVVFGGMDSEGSLLNDMWQVDMSQLPARISWRQLPRGQFRAGHAAIFTDDTTILFHGGLDETNHLAETSVRFDTNSFTWAPLPGVFRQQLVKRAEGNDGGKIAGIVVGCIAAVAVVFGCIFMVWYRRRQPKSVQDKASQNPRFSYALSGSNQRRSAASEVSTVLQAPAVAIRSSRLTPMTRTSELFPSIAETSGIIPIHFPSVAEYSERHKQAQIHEYQQDQKSKSTPNITKTNSIISNTPSTKSASSSPSIGPSIAFTPARINRSSERPTSDALWMQAILNNSLIWNENEAGQAGQAGQAAQAPVPPSPRLLQPPLTPTSPAFPRRPSTDSHRSVSSIQWVGFNEGMDYRWYPGLQVTNQRKSQLSLSTNSNPGTPTFPPADSKNSSIQHPQ
ncbi:hypothetical protein CLU79DRAFT_478769 [Phycomyces nitens]|nr:hypothetical protein CLU79DRAFT_478769 [Phycomyces nitens]